MAEVALGLVISTVVSTATQLAANALQKPNESTRLSDITPMRASYGDNLPIVFGRARLPGTIFWATPLDEYESDNVYKYRGTCAVAVCRTLGSGVFRINKVWANKRLIYEQPNIGEILDFRLGTSAQPILNEILLKDGSNQPRFKNIVYFGFILKKLQKYGMSLPNFEVEVQSNATPPTLKDVLITVMGLAGLTPSDYQFDNITYFENLLVESAILKGDGSSYRTFIEELQLVYDFTMRENKGRIEFTPVVKDVNSIVTVFPQLMGCQPETQGTEEGSSDDDTYTLYSKEEEFENDLPNEVQVEFYNYNNNFNKVTSSFIDETKIQENPKTMSFSSVGLNDTEALNLAQRAYNYARITGKQYQGITLPYVIYANTLIGYVTPEQASLIAGNVYNFALDSGTYNQTVTSVELSTTYIRKLTSHDYIGGANFVAQTNSPVYNNPTVDGSFIEATPLFVETSPLIPPNSTNRVDILVGAGATPSGFNGGTAYLERIGNINQSLGQVGGVSGVGTLTASLPRTSHLYIDNTSVLSVNINNTTLATISTDSWLNGEQILLVGEELILVREATLISPNNYNCRGLIRGWQGTEVFIQNPAPSGTVVRRVKIATTSVTASKSSFGNCGSDINITPLSTSYPIKVLGFDLEVDTYVDTLTTNFTLTGRSMRPFAPVALAYRSSISTLYWQRRTRGFFSNNFAPPLNEVNEVYDIEFYDTTFTTLLLTKTVSITQSLTLTPAEALLVEQGVNKTVYVRIYQISSAVGRGFTTDSVLDSTNNPIG